MKTKKEVILVTGGAGYIGSKIVSDLINIYKNKVIIIDDLSTGYKFLINKKAKFYCCNIGNKNKVTRIIKDNKVSSIIHCAGSLDISDGEKNNKKYYKNNVSNTENLLKVVVKEKIKIFIFSSTCAVYGNKSKIVSENSKKNPISVYGKTKLKSENLIKKYSRKFKFNYGILRYFNVAGSDIINNIGILNKNKQLIKNISFNLANDNNNISINGNNYRTYDGTCVRDYIFINDISIIHCKVLKKIKKLKKSYILNCGYGKGYSVFEIISKFEKYSKKNIKRKINPRRKGDVDKIISNSKKIKSLLKMNLNPKNKIKRIILTSLHWEKMLKYKKYRYIYGNKSS